MQDEHRIMFSNSRHNLFFADSLVREVYSFLMQRYTQIMLEPLQSHPSVCGFYTKYAAFHPFKFDQEEIIGAHDVNVFFYKLLNVICSSLQNRCAGYTILLSSFVFFSTFLKFVTLFLHSIKSYQYCEKNQ